MADSQVLERAAPPTIRAQIVKRLQVGTTKELVEDKFDPEIIYEVEVPAYAEPGDIVDVTDWAHIASYVTNGSIFLIPAESVQSAFRDQVQEHPGKTNNHNKGNGKVNNG